MIQHPPHRPARIIFVNRYFHPDLSATSQILADLAFGLARRGHRIAVVTSRQLYEAPGERLPRREVVGGVEVRRVATSRLGRRNLVGRAVDYATFYASAGWALWRLARAGDVIVAKTDPPVLSVLAAPIARWRGARLVNWLHDIFPEIAMALRVGGSKGMGALYRLLRGLRNRSLRSASANVVLGEAMAARLRGLGIAQERIRLIANWADGEVIAPVAPAANRLRASWGLGETFIVGYSGNLGRAHEYATFLGAAEAIDAARKGSVAWVFTGGGVQYERLAAEVGRRGLGSIRFMPYQPRERLAESLSAADVHLVSLRPELEGLIVPSKFYGICAAGRPTLFVGDAQGEVARLTARHECGRTVAMGDAAGLARAILELEADRALCRRMGERARRAFDAEFDRSIAVARWEALLLEVAGAVAPDAQRGAEAVSASVRSARNAR